MYIKTPLYNKNNSSINKTSRHDIIKILLKVALNNYSPDTIETQCPIKQLCKATQYETDIIMFCSY